MLRGMPAPGGAAACPGRDAESQNMQRAVDQAYPPDRADEFAFLSDPTLRCKATLAPRGARPPRVGAGPTA